MKVLTTALVFLAVVPSVTVQGTQTPRDAKAAQVLAAEYLRLVDEYRAGDDKRAIGALLERPAVETLTVQREAGRGDKWTPAAMRAAAMLETDAATQSGLPATLWPRLQMADGWLTLADRIAGTAPGAFRRRWTLAVGRLLLWNAFVTLANRVLEEAVRLFPNDPDLLLAHGTARESLAAVFTYDPASPVVAINSPSVAREQRADALSDAQSILERAVRAAPASAEARLRLARVRLARGDADRAFSLLTDTRAATPTGAVSYLRLLTLGNILEGRGDLAAAADRFQEARRLLPGAQAAYLAHAHVLQLAGQTETAATVLEAMLSRANIDRDPWMQYQAGLTYEASLLQSLRDEIRKD